jgi:hypothetical protein
MTGMCWKSVVKEGQLTNQRSVGRSDGRTVLLPLHLRASKNHTPLNAGRAQCSSLALSYSHTLSHIIISHRLLLAIVLRGVYQDERGPPPSDYKILSAACFIFCPAAPNWYLYYIFFHRLSRLRPPRGPRGASAVVCNRRDALAPQAAFPQLAGARHENVNWAAH